MEEKIVPLLDIAKLKQFKTKEHVFEDKVYLSIFVKAADIYHLELLEIIASIITCCNFKGIKYGMS